VGAAGRRLGGDGGNGRRRRAGTGGWGYDGAGDARPGSASPCGLARVRAGGKQPRRYRLAAARWRRRAKRGRGWDGDFMTGGGGGGGRHRWDGKRWQMVVNVGAGCPQSARPGERPATPGNDAALGPLLAAAAALTAITAALGSRRPCGGGAGFSRAAPAPGATAVSAGGAVVCQIRRRSRRPGTLRRCGRCRNPTSTAGRSGI